MTGRRGMGILSFRRSNIHGVVPANAGTHNHRRSLLRKVEAAIFAIERPRRMGPRFRGDDGWMDIGR
jgi:hypothetical protein